MQRVLVRPMERSLVAKEGLQGIGRAEVEPGAVEGITFVACEAVEVDGAIEHAFLDGESATDAPAGGGHILDHADFDGIVGIEFFQVVAEQGIEAVSGFGGEDDGFGEEAVFDGVARGAAFAGRGLGPPGAGTVALG